MAIPERLKQCLPGYLAHTPLYQNYPGFPPQPDVAGLSAFLQTLPLITKRDIGHGFPHNFLPPGIDLDELMENGAVEVEQTSGTSQSRTPLILPANWWSRQELRALRLNPSVAALLDSEPGARRVTINSPACSNEICYTTVPTRAERTIGNALFLSLSRFPFLWGEADLSRMAAEAQDWHPRFLDVCPVYGTVFALYCERKGIRLPGLTFIVSSYSFISQLHRRIMQRVFGVPVFNLYGSTETGHLLMESGDGLLLPSRETAWLELIQLDDRGVGELVVTTLENDFMPLVRYRIGDLVQSVDGQLSSGCRVYGRTLDSFRIGDQRITTLQVDDVFAGIEGVSHYQFVERPGHWLLRWVADNTEPQAQTLRDLQQRLEQLIGHPVEMQQTDSPLPEGSGKFRLTCPLRRPA